MYLTQGLHRAAQQFPDRPATIYQDRVFTFAEQIGRVARLAGGLRALNVHEGDRVGILSLNSDRYCEYFLAVPWAGGVLNPVNTRWSADEIAYSLRDSTTEVLLVDDEFTAIVPKLLEMLPSLREVVYCGELSTPEGMVGYEEMIATSAPVDDAHRAGEDLAGIFYTGGTSGFPKGVMLTHTNLVSSAMGAMASEYGLARDGVLLHTAPMFHAADFSPWMQQTIRGGTHVMLSKFEATEVLAIIERRQITELTLVPTMIQRIVDHPDVGAYDLSSVRAVLYGGSAITPAVLVRVMNLLPSLRLTQCYGMTELATVSTLLGPDDHWAARTDASRLSSAGRAAPHNEIRILDADGRELPPRQSGEIVVRGSNASKRYWNNPKATEDTFRNGWVHTGDIGYVDEGGYLFVQDRIKDMIVTGGENVYSAEVETALAEHPAVAAVAVIGLPDEQWGERVHAAIILQNEAIATVEEIRHHAKSSIAAYKVPRTIEFVDTLPVSGTGKILKRALKAKYSTTTK